jgi:hypothetical protein
MEQPLGHKSGQKLFNDPAMNIRQSEVPARMTVGELFMVKTKQVHDGCL